MTELVTLRQRGQLTLPKWVRDLLNIGQGDHLQVEMDGGAVVLRPARVVVDGTPEAKAREQQALEDIKAGRVHSFDTTEELLDFLGLPREVEPAG